MSANPSDLEVSRQRNIELVAENFDLKSEVANFRKEQKSSVEKQERKNAEFENRLAKVDQGSEVVDEQPQVKTEESAVDTKVSTGNEEVVSFLVKGDALGSQNVKEAKLEESAVDVTPSGFSAPITQIPSQPRMR
ncbi:hypothetical protein RhiirA1_470773 [Rhizophagus irregularis]|nr:hypothetical protein RhiirA1_470773 [Rhizophagus irregularis]PKY21067.1 hypothetical protein RhiirB3_434562 [Rhizophagus irregularis]